MFFEFPPTIVLNFVIFAYVVADVLLYLKSTGSAEMVEFSWRTSDMPLKYDFCPQKSVSCAFVKQVPGNPR